MWSHSRKSRSENKKEIKEQTQLRKKSKEKSIERTLRRPKSRFVGKKLFQFFTSFTSSVFSFFFLSSAEKENLMKNFFFVDFFLFIFFCLTQKIKNWKVFNLKIFLIQTEIIYCGVFWLRIKNDFVKVLYFILGTEGG